MTHPGTRTRIRDDLIAIESEYNLVLPDFAAIGQELRQATMLTPYEQALFKAHVAQSLEHDRLLQALDGLELSGYQAITYDGSQLIATTNEIIILGVPLGQFQILIPADDPTRLRVYGYSQDGQHPPKHPHIYHTGTICYGDQEGLFLTLLAAYEIVPALILLRDFLGQYNSKSAYFQLTALCSCESLEPVHPCSYCGESGCTHCILDECHMCSEMFCQGCILSCHTCDVSMCDRCGHLCGDCGNRVCTDCYNQCDHCGRTRCQSCLCTCSSCGQTCCNRCSDFCSQCGQNTNSQCTVSCYVCIEGPVYCTGCSNYCTYCNRYYCVDHSDHRCIKSN